MPILEYLWWLSAKLLTTNIFVLYAGGRFSLLSREYTVGMSNTTNQGHKRVTLRYSWTGDCSMYGIKCMIILPSFSRSEYLRRLRKTDCSWHTSWGVRYILIEQLGSCCNQATGVDGISELATRGPLCSSGTDLSRTPRGWRSFPTLAIYPLTSVLENQTQAAAATCWSFNAISLGPWERRKEKVHRWSYCSSLFRGKELESIGVKCLGPELMNWSWDVGFEFGCRYRYLSCALVRALLPSVCFLRNLGVARCSNVWDDYRLYAVCWDDLSPPYFLTLQINKAAYPHHNSGSHPVKVRSITYSQWHWRLHCLLDSLWLFPRQGEAQKSIY